MALAQWRFLRWECEQVEASVDSCSYFLDDPCIDPKNQLHDPFFIISHGTGTINLAVLTFLHLVDKQPVDLEASKTATGTLADS